MPAQALLFNDIRHMCHRTCDVKLRVERHRKQLHNCQELVPFISNHLTNKVQEAIA